jgi:hypothetical protein
MRRKRIVVSSGSHISKAARPIWKNWTEKKVL